jgi:hypothetical protein
MEEYIEQLLQEVGVPEGTDPEVRAQLASDLAARANDMVNKRLIEAMSDEDVAAFDKLLDEQPENLQAMQQFIDEHVPDKNRVVGAALLEFRTLYLGEAA